MVLSFCGLRASRLRVLRRIVRHANAVMPCACVLLSCGFSCSGLCVFRQAVPRCVSCRFAVSSAVCAPQAWYLIHTSFPPEAACINAIVPVAGCRHVFPMMWCLCFSVWKIYCWRDVCVCLVLWEWCLWKYVWIITGGDFHNSVIHVWNSQIYV